MIRLHNQSTRKPTAVCAIITILILSVAVTAISSSMQYSYAQTGVGIRPANSCQKLPVSGVTASGTGDGDDHNGPDHDADDRNVPANVLDNNLNTRWSNLGVGSFIQAGLGGQKTICSVDIAWYRGNLRVNNFVISASSDGTSFTNVFTGKSSGTTLSAETYSLPTTVTARFVRVTVNGNTENNWASITELSVDGFSNNNPPTADNKSINTTAGTPVTITLTGTSPIPNDVNLKFSVLSMPQNGKLATGTTSNTVTYTPNPGFSGSDSFTYKATDGQGVDSNIATVTITVKAAQNNPPIADSKTVQTNAGTPVQITLTGTDPIPGDTLKFSVVAIPQHGTLSNPTSNTVTYTPNTGFSGTDTFTYKATTKNGLAGGVDSNIATVTITVNALPHPTADNKSISTNAGTPVTITLTGTDPIPGDTLKFSVVAIPQHGTLSNPTSNTVIYTPTPGFSGTDTFTYRATDGQRVNSTVAKVMITVNAPPPPLPTANNINIQTNKETPIGITLTGTDPIPGDTLKFSVVGSPTHGIVAPGTVSSNVFYTPNTGFIGTDSFTYKATDGQGQGSNIATVTIIVSNSSSGTLDQFGVKEIYPTKAGGEQWFMNMNDPNHDNRTDPQTTLTKNADGSWKVTSNAVRFNVFTSSGYHHDLIATLNQGQLAAKGYMQSPNDWKNIEMTGYVKFNKGDTSDGFTWYARGGHHTGSGFPLGCEGTSIKEELDFAGTTRFEKEQWHVHYVFTPHKPATDPIQGKWVGYKAVMYNIEQNGTIVVKEEIWLDPNNNGNWVKVNEFTDAGGFGDQGHVCGGKSDQIITWGGPIATFRKNSDPCRY